MQMLDGSAWCPQTGGGSRHRGILLKEMGDMGKRSTILWSVWGCFYVLDLAIGLRVCISASRGESGQSHTATSF